MGSEIASTPPLEAQLADSERRPTHALSEERHLTVTQEALMERGGPIQDTRPMLRDEDKQYLHMLGDQTDRLPITKEAPIPPIDYSDLPENEFDRHHGLRQLVQAYKDADQVLGKRMTTPEQEIPEQTQKAEASYTVDVQAPVSKELTHIYPSVQTNEQRAITGAADGEMVVIANNQAEMNAFLAKELPRSDSQTPETSPLSQPKRTPSGSLFGEIARFLRGERREHEEHEEVLPPEQPRIIFASLTPDEQAKTSAAAIAEAIQRQAQVPAPPEKQAIHV